MNAQHIAQGVWELIGEGMPLQTALSRAQDMLKKYNAMPLYKNVLNSLSLLALASESRTTCEIKTAHQFSDDSYKIIAEKLGVSDGSYEKKIDANLLGGFVATHAGKQYDMSVYTQLKKIKRNLEIA